MAEAGFPDYKSSALFGVYVAAGTPMDIVHKLNATINKLISTPAMAQRLRELGAEPNPKSVDAFSALYRAEIEKWKTIVRQANIPQID